MTHFATHLRRERLSRQLSQEALAEALGVSLRTISRWEQGKAIPQANIRLQLVQFFNLPPETLFGEQESVPHPSQDALEQSDHREKDVPSSTPLATEEVHLPSTVEQTRSSQEKDPPQPAHALSRRQLAKNGILLGMATIGVAALGTGGLWAVYSAHPSQGQHTASPTAPHPQRFHHLLDPTTSNWINHLDWSPDGRLLAAANGTNVVSVWDIQEERIVLSYPTLNSWVNDISWSKNNLIAAATATAHAGAIQIWRLPNTDPILTLKREYALRSVCWSPHSDYIAISGHSPLVEVWNPFTSQQVSYYSDTLLGSQGITRIKWSPSGQMLACAADDGTAHVWEVSTGKRLLIYRGHTNRVHDLAWSPDGRFIVSGGEDRTSQVWEAVSGRTITVYRGHTGIVEGVGWSPKGNYVASASADRTVHLWTPLVGRCVTIYEEQKSIVETALWSHDGTTLAIGTESEGIGIWSSP